MILQSILKKKKKPTVVSVPHIWGQNEQLISDNFSIFILLKDTKEKV